MPIKKISVFDTTISDYNLGNEIIMEAVYLHLREIFPSDFFFKLPYMEISRHTLGYIRTSDLVFFGGTNALSSEMEKYRQWGINLLNSFAIKDMILLGVGWWQYQGKESLYTKFILNQVLSRKYNHSVRDSYTEMKLKKLGFSNVINTGCPSMWNLSAVHCKEIPKRKAEAVILTFTDYKKNFDRDVRLFEILRKKYKEIFVWIQGSGDKEYVDAICKGGVRTIPPTLRAFVDLLSRQEIDYIGTRLHAGIKALQHKKRAIIIGVDNRALECGKDFNLPVLSENSLNELEDLIDTNFEVAVHLPIENILLWKDQFKENDLGSSYG